MLSRIPCQDGQRLQNRVGKKTERDQDPIVLYVGGKVLRTSCCGMDVGGALFPASSAAHQATAVTLLSSEWDGILGLTYKQVYP